MIVRRSAVAGSFYPASPEQLREELKRCLPDAAVQKQPAIGVVSPHAGYFYSGAVAGQLYQQIALPRRVVILSPNHTGFGQPVSIMTKGQWELPLGAALIDEPLAASFLNDCPLLKEDELAHRTEHSLEVQLPFLQYLKKSFRFVPVTLMHLPFKQCETIGLALARTIRETAEPVLIIASSDLNHYESQKITDAKDQLAIDAILSLDPARLYETVKKNGITMCGVIPTTVMLIAARELGAQQARLIQHATSGDVTGDYASVVGYASLIVA